MSSESESTLAELLALLAAGRKIEAIQRYREVTGAGLAAAKETVEALERGEPLPTKESLDATMEAEIVSLLEGGKKIQAIKLYRTRTGVGLKEAKECSRGHGRTTGSSRKGRVPGHRSSPVGRLGGRHGGGRRETSSACSCRYLVFAPTDAGRCPGPAGAGSQPHAAPAGHQDRR